MAIVGGGDGGGVGSGGAGVWHLMAGRARIYFACKRAQFAIWTRPFGGAMCHVPQARLPASFAIEYLFTPAEWAWQRNWKLLRVKPKKKKKKTKSAFC